MTFEATSVQEPGTRHQRDPGGTLRSIPSRVALVGCGQHAVSTLLPSLLSSPNVSLVAVCDLDEARMIPVVSRLPTVQAFTSFEELIGRTDLDCVVVAAPPQVHASVAGLSLENGRHVFVEKPPAVGLAEMTALADLAAACGATTAVGHNLRHSPAWTAFKNTIADPEFGDVVSLEVSYTASQPRGPRWGLESVRRSFLLSHAIHAVDLIADTVGEVDVVGVQGRMLEDGACVAHVQFRSKSGIVGVLSVNNCGPRFRVTADALSSRSHAVRLASLRRLEWCGRNDSGRWSSVWEARGLEGAHVIAGYQHEIDAFVSDSRSQHRGRPSFQHECFVYEFLERVLTQLEAAP
jgi:phthalate 4,5-cis-dihydrodiol dehydrogenase